MNYDSIKKNLISRDESYFGSFLLHQNLITEDQLLLCLYTQNFLKKQEIFIPLGIVIVIKNFLSFEVLQKQLLLYYNNSFEKNKELAGNIPTDPNFNFMKILEETALSGHENTSATLSQTSVSALKLSLSNRKNQMRTIKDDITRISKLNKTKANIMIIKNKYELYQKLQQEIKEISSDLRKLVQ